MFSLVFIQLRKQSNCFLVLCQAQVLDVDAEVSWDTVFCGHVPHFSAELRLFEMAETIEVLIGFLDYLVILVHHEADWSTSAALALHLIGLFTVLALKEQVLSFSHGHLGCVS